MCTYIHAYHDGCIASGHRSRSIISGRGVRIYLYTAIRVGDLTIERGPACDTSDCDRALPCVDNVIGVERNTIEMFRYRTRYTYIIIYYNRCVRPFGRIKSNNYYTRVLICVLPTVSSKKNLLTDNRRAFLFEKLKHALGVQCNNTEYIFLFLIYEVK